MRDKVYEIDAHLPKVWYDGVSDKVIQRKAEGVGRHPRSVPPLGPKPELGRVDRPAGIMTCPVTRELGSSPRGDIRRKGDEAELL